MNKRKLYELARAYLASYHMDLDPREPVENLSVTQQKMIEIAKALVAKVSVLVLDEPTDVLEDQARNELFDIIRRLKSEQEIGFIYISHRYAEVHQLGDRVTILRDGRRVGTWPIADISLDSIIEKMTGGKTGYSAPGDGGGNRRGGAQRARHRETAEAERHFLRCPPRRDRRGDRPHGAGQDGAGPRHRRHRPHRFRHHLHRREGNQEPDASDGIRNGIAYMTENRKSEGLILGQSIQSNYALPSIRRLSPVGLVDFRAVGNEIDALMRKLQIKATGRNVEAGTLSGGNQQKVVLAKWLGTSCRVLLVQRAHAGNRHNGRAEVYGSSRSC